MQHGSGKHSFGYCDITGERVPYRKLKTQWNGLRVSPRAYEAKHPQLTPKRFIKENLSLKDPRPTDGFSVGTVTSLSVQFPSTSGQGSEPV